MSIQNEVISVNFYGEVFGFQALQNVDNWAMEIFAAYRHFNVEQGNGFPVEDADLLFAGSRVKF